MDTATTKCGLDAIPKSLGKKAPQLSTVRTLRSVVREGCNCKVWYVISVVVFPHAFDKGATTSRVLGFGFEDFQ